MPVTSRPIQPSLLVHSNLCHALGSWPSKRPRIVVSGMPLRRAHTKSRYGCDQCRRRRVKCDEQGPPCSNCVLREMNDCTYSRLIPARLLATARRPSQGPVALREATTTAPNITSPPLNNGISPEAAAPNARPAPPRAVDELELMHKYATDTYQSLCINESEVHVWQIDVPRLALEYRYLMNGILALTSLHIATTLELGKAPVYIDTGLEYHSLSLEPFRTAIENLTPANCDAVFALSIITTAISIALPHLTANRGNAVSMTENIITVFELLQGVKKILTIGQSWINLELFSQGEFWTGNSTTTLDPDTDTALRQLATLNEQTKSSTDARQFSINKDVIDHLRHCFMKFARSNDPAPVLAWLAAVDKGFVDSLRCREPFSLLVLAYWCLLLDELDGQRWWARNSGRALASELLDALSAEDLLWESCLAWVRRKIFSKFTVEGIETSSA